MPLSLAVRHEEDAFSGENKTTTRYCFAFFDDLPMPLSRPLVVEKVLGCGVKVTGQRRGAEINGSFAPSLQARGNSSRGAGYRSSISFHLCSIFQHSSPPLPLSLTLPSRSERLEDTPDVFRTDTRARTRRIAAGAIIAKARMQRAEMSLPSLRTYRCESLERR